jgi:hypothetical protein
MRPTLAEKNEARIKTIEDALRAVCDDVFIDGLPNNVAALFIELAKRIDGDT